MQTRDSDMGQMCQVALNCCRLTPTNDPYIQEPEIASGSTMWVPGRQVVGPSSPVLQTLPTSWTRGREADPQLALRHPQQQLELLGTVPNLGLNLKWPDSQLLKILSENNLHFFFPISFD